MLLFKLECKRVFSGLINKLVLLLFVISGVLSVYQGAQHYKSQRIDQYKSTVVFKKEREHVATRDSLPEAGSLAYHAASPTTWHLSPWAALFNGETTTAMVALKIRATALQSQIFNREIVNPAHQRAGGLDLGFVLVYLLPLVIGIFTVTLIADEQQAGRWRLLNALPSSAFSQLVRQLGLRFAIIWLLVVTLLIAAALVLSLAFDSVFWFVLFAVTLYMLFWFGVAGLIIGFGKSAVFNSLAFLSSWIVIAVLIPSSIHLYLSQQFNNSAPLEMSLQQRMVLNDGWDKDKQTTLNEFLALETKWQNTQPLGEAFDWKWYYAQQHLSDLAVEALWQQYLAANIERQELLAMLSVLSPALFFSHKMNQLSNTSSSDQLAYQQAIENYHQQVRYYFYDFLFFAKSVSKKDIEDFPLFIAKAKVNSLPLMSLLFSTLFVILLTLIVLIRLKKLPPF